jgi:hypothetical protein
MDQLMLRKHFAQAETHVHQGEHHIARQFRIIEDLREGGHDLVMALHVLNTLEQCQVLHVDHRDRLAAQLSTRPR